MTGEEMYLDHKKKVMIGIIDNYNNRIGNLNWDKFKIDKDHFDLEKTLCTPQICKDCGKCCLRFPCVFSPYDFLDLHDLNYMRNILNTGIICISKNKKWDTLILRPRGIADLEYITSFSINWDIADGTNPCILNSNEGCLLSTAWRPSEGLAYYAKKGKRHKIMYNEEDYVKDYKQFQDVLQILVQEYRDKEIPLDKCCTQENVKIFMKRMSEYSK